MNIRKTIKNLRRERDMTQEQLAEYLSISPQAVSRWETDLALPDITMLPALSSVFGVSVDELLGMNRSADIHKKVHELRKAEEYDEAVALLREELKQFPNDGGLASALAQTLAFGSRENIEEAISLCEKVVDGSSPEKRRSTARACFACCIWKPANSRKPPR